MLESSNVATRLPARDLERARRFYAEKLGLEPVEERPGGLLYRCGSGAFALFESAGGASGDHTQMGWEVADIEATVTALRARGVVFEEYDLPGLRTIDGIAHIEGNYPSKGVGEKGTWFKDSEGNLLGIGQPVDPAPMAGYAPVNGLEMYYEIHGTGEPLILLHGGAGTIGMFGRNLAALSASHRIIAVELQAHGHTADIERPLRFEVLADDVVGLLDHLGIERTDLMGYSLGGGVAVQLTIRHPERVRRLVVVSVPFKRDGWYPEIRASMDAIGPEQAEGAKRSPMYEAYAEVAPRPEDWPTLFAKLGDLLKRAYDWSREVAAIDAPTLIVAADADGFPPAHAAAFYGLLGGGQRDAGWDGSGRPTARLAILAGTTHYDIFASPLLASVVTPFLDAPMLGKEATRR